MAGAPSGTDETLAAPAKTSPGTDETLDGDPTTNPRAKRASNDATLAASAQSLEPVSSRGKRVSINPDYTELVEVDPVHYSVKGELARGGMGRILEARDRRLGRGVAIKQLIDRDAQAVARFEREVRITARLQHPSIVHVHEAGRWPTGEPFYSMELVDGSPLDRSIAKAKTLRDRLALVPNVISAVDALAYAHSEGVIHRDLKPGNVLVGGFGETVVIDWGLAKDLRAADGIADSLKIGPYRDARRSAPKLANSDLAASDESETVAGSVIGTPAYMPPEQARGDRVSERADVYALGALLYHVLAGVPPFDAASPAALLGKVLDGPPLPLGERDAEIPVELVAIVEKAMARDPAQRFANASEMATELKRFHTGQLVASHRYTRWELVRRWVRRNRAAVAVGSIAIVTLAVLATVGIVKIIGERDRADHEAAVAQRRLDESIIERAQHDLDIDPTRAVARLLQLGGGSKHWNAARMIAADAASRGISEHVIDAEPADYLAFSPDGTKLAALEQQQIRVWNTKTWQAQTYALGDELVLAFAFTPKGILWVTSFGTIRRWDLVAAKDTVLRAVPLDTAPGNPPQTYVSAAIDANGRLIALFAPFSDGIVIDLEGPTRTFARGYKDGVFTPDGAALLAFSGTNGGVLDRVELATGTVTNITKTMVTSAATDGRRIWIGSYSGGRDAQYEIHELTTPLGHGNQAGAPISLTLTPAGELASTTVSDQVRDDSVTITWPTLNAPVQMKGHAARPLAIATSSDGRLASIDRDGMLRIWRVPRRTHVPWGGPTDEQRSACSPSLPLSKHVTTVQHAFLTTDRREIVLAKKGPALEIRDLQGRARRLEITARPPGVEPEAMLSCSVVEVGMYRFVEGVPGDGAAIVQWARSRDGKQVATLGRYQEGVVVHWNVETGQARQLGGHEGAQAIALHPDGRQILTYGSNDGVVMRWNTATGERAPVAEIKSSIDSLAYTPDGQAIVVSGYRGMYLLPALGGGALKSVAIDSHVSSLVVSSDGKLVAGINDITEVSIWNLETNTTRALRGHTGAVQHVAFSPDGKRVVSSGLDKTTRVWNLADGTHVTLLGHEAPASSFDFVDDRWLLTTSSDGTARVVDLSNNTSRPLGRHLVPVLLAYPVAGSYVTIDTLGQTTHHPDDLPRDEAGLRRWLESATTMRLD